VSKLNNSLLKGRVSALLTKHKKEQVIKPIFEQATGCRVDVLSDYDTDMFGTFTGDVERPGTQLETARMKARRAIDISGLDIGLSSEGSFGPHPSIPFVPLNIELVMLIDDRGKLEICGEWSGSDTNYSRETVDSLDKAKEFAVMAGFPQHQLVVKPASGQPRDLIKGIHEYEELAKAIAWAISLSPERRAIIETDMRAHANPTRMANILKATQNLIDKLNSVCSACGAPGFWISERKIGLPCEWCETPTNEILSEISKCLKCGNVHEHLYPRGKKASAGRCPNCNP
jgi:hypothetical protein